METMEHVPADEHDNTRLFKIGSTLSFSMKKQLVRFLRKNADVFAWTHGDMTGISPDIACHNLNVDPTKLPVKQKKRSMGMERSNALNEEVKNLLANDFIREAIYPEWISNPVLVKKPNGNGELALISPILMTPAPKTVSRYQG